MRRLMRDEWQFGLGQISSLQRHPKPEISTGPPLPNTRLPMPKDNEVDERVTPVAWQWLDTSNFRKSIPSAAIKEHWNPLYSAATVAELRAKADAAERRVGELEVALRDLIEDVQHPDHEAGDWSERVCIRNAQAALTGADPT